ncbi:ribosome small subunit-dependent GTPase A [Ottowia sp. GY511]|uniref:Small ribosomal subunit biogenesis GTPase RsgA n=1 Tax=Ottowia flava TaxID=2675430 RepID=A0ABW4KXX9_9BURK|nr:ribosome small subunit-dependent GTPase A [Ottowia sp. GY511]TXK26285.1 ribosome small subunit-dependent GTPase A [Ottowia sp. GY511]
MSRPARATSKGRAAAAAADQAALLPGLVIASHGRHCVVETPEGARVICHPRGKKLGVVVGDRVRWQPSQDEGTVEQIEPRRNLLYRQDEIRTKSFAANLDQVLILVAAEPEFSEHQLARALIACEAEHITPLIVLNKADLTELFARAWQRLAPYRAMGYSVLPMAAKPKDGQVPEGCLLDDVIARLQGHTTLILGPSGAGKSTLINRAVPGASALTGEISQALNSGKHTTTTTTWYWLDAARTGALIDSPGFQEFGLRHIDPAQLAAYMPDLKPHVADCKFYNCTHLHEPGCGVRAAVAGTAQTPRFYEESACSPTTISANRYKIYSDLFDELSAVPNYGVG